MSPETGDSFMSGSQQNYSEWLLFIGCECSREMSNNVVLRIWKSFYTIVDQMTLLGQRKLLNRNRFDVGR